MLKKAKEHLFILTAMLCSFFISMDYAVIRPVSNALFITDYGVNFFPYAWISSIPLNLLLVGLYNKYLPKLGCLNSMQKEVQRNCFYFRIKMREFLI